jgi:hypothetical protein
MRAVTDGGHVADWEVVFGKTEEDAGFANRRVADDNEFEQMIIARLLILCHLSDV